jgi:hypothetical protein
MICEGREVVGLLARHPFANQPVRPDIVRFVSILSRRPRSTPSMPVSFPSTGKWLLKILARESRFVFGVYRRHMKVSATSAGSTGSLGSQSPRATGIPSPPSPGCWRTPRLLDPASDGESRCPILGCRGRSATRSAAEVGASCGTPLSKRATRARTHSAVPLCRRG